MGKSRTASIEARFWSKVDRTGECWTWTAGRYKAGYGQFTIDHNPQLAHRVAWRLANGEIPDRMCVCHRCDNPSCVRPDHLFLGTDRDNALDMMAKGRHRCGALPVFRGAMNHHAKLTEDDVIDIRTLSAFGATQKDLAQAFGVKVANISKILLGQVWRHVTAGLVGCALLLLASCGGAVSAAPCALPASFLSCDTSETEGTPRCWSADTTDWLLYPDGSYVHELRISNGYQHPVETTVLCRGRTE